MPSASYRPLQPSITTCRSCHAHVFWVASVNTGQPFLCDAAPVPKGNVVLIDHQTAKVLGPAEAEAAAARERTYQIHFVTCKDAVGWRRKRGIPEPLQGARG